MLKVANSVINASQIATPITFAGDVTLSTGNLVIGTSGKGIDFSATPGTGTSELLADYEEGTWTATLTGSTTAPTVPVTATCTYTKVGRIVTVNFFFANVSTVGATGSAKVEGLPYSALSNSYFGTVSAFNFGAVAGVAETFSNYITIVNPTTSSGIAIPGTVGNYLFGTATYFV